MIATSPLTWKTSAKRFTVFERGAVLRESPLFPPSSNSIPFGERELTHCPFKCNSILCFFLDGLSRQFVQDAPVRLIVVLNGPALIREIDVS